jgi:hypothetical protein
LRASRSDAHYRYPPLRRAIGRAKMARHAAERAFIKKHTTFIFFLNFLFFASGPLGRLDPSLRSAAQRSAAQHKTKEQSSLRSQLGYLDSRICSNYICHANHKL